MSALIELPDNQQRRLELGQQAMAKADWPTAIEHLEAAYMVEQTGAINLLLTRALVANKQYAQALAYAEEQLAFYLATPTQQRYFADLLITNNHFIRAWQLAKQLAPQDSEMLTTKLTIAEKHYRQADAKAIKINQQALYNISGQSVAQQLAILRSAEQLPLTEYQLSAIQVLNNPFATQMLKSTVLESLTKLQLPQVVTLQWFDEQRSVIPAQLPLIDEQPALQMLVGQLTVMLKDSDPALLIALTEEATLYLANLYPFASEVVVDSVEWANALYANATGQNELLAQLSEKTKNWLLTLQKLVLTP